MRTGLAIVGGVIGILLVLAAIFNWKIVPIPSDVPSVGSPASGMATPVRAAVGVVGAILVVLAVLTLTGAI